VSLQRSTSTWYSRVPCCFQASSCSLSSRIALAGLPMIKWLAGISALAFTNAAAPTMLFSPMTAPSITTAFMPTSALRRITQP